MWGKAFDWLLLFLMVYGLGSSWTTCTEANMSAIDTGWNATSLFWPLLMELNTIMPGKMFHPKMSASNNGFHIQTVWLFWFIMMSCTTLPFGWARQQLKEIPCSNFTAAVSTWQGVALGNLMFLPTVSKMAEAELPGTHIEWLVLPIQTLPNSPSLSMQNCWALV